MTTDDGTLRISIRPRRRSDGDAVGVFVVLVSVAAVAVVVATWLRYPVAPLDEHWLELSILLAVLLWSEMKPINVVRAGGVDSVVASTTFAFAIFLLFGAIPAMAAQAFVSVIADVSARKPLVKVSFNIAQYWIAWGAAGVVFASIESAPPGFTDDFLSSRWYLAVVVSGFTYFVVNNVLVGIAVGLSEGGRVLHAARSTVLSEWRTDIVLLAFAPIVLIVLDQSIVALPLLFVPILAIYRSVAISAEKEHLALHDSLTGLPNRYNFTTVLSSRIAGGDDHMLAAVMLFDLDHFKEINDTLGHQAGDELLRMIGPRITRVLPAGSTVGRLGGDEFAVIVPLLSDECEALAIAHRIAGELEAPFILEGFNIEVKGSIGVALHPADGTTSDELIKRADIAMYVAKTRGTVVERYDVELDHHSTRRLEMVGEMRAAIANGDMVLYFQPKLDLATGHITEVEALVRWVHPRLGIIPPTEFVPLSEHTGLIRPLTTHVLGEAARHSAMWRAAGHDLVVAVNLSARSLHDDRIVEEVSTILDAAGLPARLLRLEITEGSIMSDPPRAMRLLEQLGQMGVRLSIDDFGTGYSSLAYLKDLPVDELKIDRSFVMHILDSEGDQVIVRSIIDLARSLGITSVAEGVETAASLAWLSGAGCDQAQGYHIARPMPAELFTEWLAQFVSAPPALSGVRYEPRRTAVTPWDSRRREGAVR